MNRLRRSTLQGRLILTVLIASVLALACVMGGVLVYESTDFRPRALKQLRVPADILKELLRPALDFDAQEDADRYLEKYCESQPGILVAVVYDARGEVFARYSPTGNLAAVPESPEPPGALFSGRDLTIWERIEGNNQTLGHLYLHEQLPALFARLPQYSLMLGTVLIALLIVGAMLLLGARRDILAPLRKLTDSIEKTNNLELPLPVEWDSRDELGYLINGYNKMIGRLKKSNDDRRESERLFRGLFENTEVSVWNEDLSDIYTELNRLRSIGVSDLRQYLVKNQQAARDMTAMVKVIDVNQATLTLFGANHKNEILPQIDKTFGSDAIDVFIDELCAIWDKQPVFRSEAEFMTLDGKALDLIISFQIPQTADGFHSIPVTLIDITERKQVEMALRESEARLSEAQTRAHIGYWEVDLATQQVTGSAEIFRILGLDPALPVRFADVKAMHYLDDRQSMEQRLARAGANPAGVQEDVRIIKPDGRMVWIERRTEIVRDEAGNEIGLTGTAQDITERKQAELRETTRVRTLATLANGDPLEQVLATLVQGVEAEHQGTLGSVLLLDNTSTHLLTGAAPSLPAFYNEAIHGVAIGPAVGSCGTAAFRGERVVVTDIQTDPLWRAEAKALAARAGLAACWSEPIRGSHGRVIGTFAFYYAQPREPGEAELASISAGAQIAAVAIERKQAELALQESEAKFSAAFELASIGKVLVSPEGQVLRVNPAFCALLGYSAPELLKMTFQDVTHPDDLAASQEHITQLLAGETEAYEIEKRYIHRDGHVVWAMLNVSIAHLGEGTPAFLIAEITDITARKVAEAALIDTNRELLRSNAELQQFAYVASHDLVEPLRSVSSSVQLLQKRYAGELDARADEFIEHAVGGSQRMQALIEDLLTLARIGSGSFEQSSVEMATILAAACDNLQAAITESNASITHDTLPLIVVNESQWIQLLQNLMANAIKFRGDKPAVIHVGAKRENNEWVFSVADQGIGIEPQFFQRIFELFKRLHGRTEYSGTGVGLALCEKIVSQHGGRIWVESTFGQGATFFFTLPVNKQAHRSLP